MQQVLTSGFFCFLIFTISCSNNDDQKKLGEAQACLNQVSQNTPTDAVNCYSYIASVDSPQADSLRCSIAFLAGGITTSKIIDAAKEIDNGSSAEEVFISLLVFNGINVSNTGDAANGTQAMTNVSQAASYCNSSGVKGLMYLGNFAVAGTALVKSIIGSGANTYWENPTKLTTAQIESGVQNCVSTPANCDPTDVGNAILVLGDSYCSGKTDDEQCAQVLAAIDEGGGSAEQIGASFYEQLYCSKDEHKNEAVCTN